jgi:hypothetical protein
MASCVTGPSMSSRLSTARTLRGTIFFVSGNCCCSANFLSIKFSVAPQSIMAIVVCSFPCFPFILTRKITFSFFLYGPMLDIISVGPAVVILVVGICPRSPPSVFTPGDLLFPLLPRSPLLPMLFQQPDKVSYWDIWLHSGPFFCS